MRDNTKLDYCKTCLFRRDRKDIDKATVRDDKGSIITLGQESLGNTGKFCEIGYKVNPKDFITTHNALKNGSKPCHKNPFLKSIITD